MADISLTVEFTLRNFCDDSELKETPLVDLVNWMIEQEGLFDLILGCDYKLVNIEKKRD